MLELARLLAADPKLLAHNDVILLFNGAEESILPAAHGFITQHPWARDLFFIALRMAFCYPCRS